MMYICVPCGYIYNEEKQDQLWSLITEDWVCPDCASSHNNFAEFSIEKPKNEIDDIFRSYDI